MPRLSRAPVFVFGGAFFLLGAIFLFIGGSTFLEEQHYQQQGVRAPAVATGKALHRATSDSGTTYEISYRVNPAEGTPFEQTERADVHLWERVERDSPLVVQYVRGQPESARVVRDSSNQKAISIGALSVGGVLALFGLFVILKGGRWLSSSGADASMPADAARPDVTGSTGPRLRRSFWVWFGGVFLLFGLTFFSIGIVLFYVDWTFAREAQPAQGIVLTKEIRVSRDSNSSSGTTTTTKHYEATYRFTVEEAPFEGRDELSYDEWQRLVEREPVEVLYRPRNPSSNHLAAHNAWLLKTLFTLLGSVFTVLGGTLLVRAVRNDRLERRLRQNGVSAQATVTELHARNLRVNNVQLWRLHYDYLDFEGHRQMKTIDMPEGEAQQWKVGDIGSVLYDSTRPAEAVWLGRP